VGARRRPVSPLPAPLSWLSPLWPLLFLILVWAGKEFIGERWWLTTWAVYLPQVLFLIPSLGLAALALLLRRWPALVGPIVHFNTGLPHPGHERAWDHPRRNMQEAAAVRAAQADHLVRIVRGAGRPLVVGGDFNSPPDSYACRRMLEGLQSAFASAGSGFGWSFSSSHPLLRIDHLFASHDLEVLGCRVLPANASDHRPLVADFAWR
jgi:hypothetical protein